MKTPEMPGGEAMDRTKVEESDEPALTSLTKMSDEQLRQIAALKYNAVHTTEGRSSEEREAKIEALYQSYVDSRAHGEALVLEEDGKIVGFIAVSEPMNSDIATIDDILIDAKYGDEARVKQLLMLLENDLKEKHFKHAVIKASAADKDLRRLLNFSGSTFFQLENVETEEDL